MPCAYCTVHAYIPDKPELSKILPPSYIRTLSASIELILNGSQQLLALLTPAIEARDLLAVATIFIDHAPWFRMYNPFTSTHLYTHVYIHVYTHAYTLIYLFAGTNPSQARLAKQ